MRAARDFCLFSKFYQGEWRKNMEIYNIPEIARNVFSVGSKDWNRRMFDALIPLPRGYKLQSYLVKGEEENSSYRYRESWF